MLILQVWSVFVVDVVEPTGFGISTLTISTSGVPSSFNLTDQFVPSKI